MAEARQASSSQTSTAQARMLTWPDFSAVSDRLALQILPVASGKQYLLLRGGEAYPDHARAMGFVRNRTGLWLRQDLNLSRDLLTHWKRVMPRMTFVQRPLSEVVNHDALRQTRLKTLLEQSTYLGMNRRGQEVYEDMDGRFVRAPRGLKIVREESEAAERDTPDVFLHGGDDQSLRRSAEGLVFEMTLGNTVRQAEMARFIRAVTGEDGLEAGDPRAVAAHRAVEDAVARSVARLQAGGARDLFEETVRISERLAVSGASSMPTPVAVTLGRLMGTPAEFEGASVTVSLRGNGAVTHRLPRTARIKAAVPDAATEDRVAALSRTLLPNMDIAVGGADIHAESDITFVNVDPADATTPLDQPVERHGQRLGRKAHQDIIDILDNRQPDGRSIFVLPEPGDDAGWGRLRGVLGMIAEHYHVESLAGLDPVLMGGQVGEAGTQVLIVGPRRSAPQPDAPNPVDALQTVRDHAGLWAWSTKVIAERQALLNAIRIERGARGPGQPAAAGEAGAVLPDGRPEPARENPYQVPYVAGAHRVGEATAMQPRFMEGASREALARLARRHGDIAEWVCAELRYDSVEEMARYLSPEQVDGIALEIDARLRGESVIIADQTGLGKGREGAALIRWSILRGEPVVFLTEQAKLFTDICRDLSDIGSLHLINPLIVNGSAKVFDNKTGEELFRAPDRSVMDEVYASGRIPDGVNLVLATYSQLNQKARPNQPVPARLQWFRDIIPQCRALLDESHNAAGRDSNTGKNMLGIVETANHVTYMSATWAKNIKALPLYVRALPKRITPKELQDALRRGGVTVQEALTTLMAKQGRLIRREIDLGDVEFVSYTDINNEERNRDYAAQLAPVLAAMNFLSGDVDKLVSRLNERTKRDIEQARAQGRNVPSFARMQATRIGFGSPHYMLSRLFDMAIKTDAAVDIATSSLERNEKPIIVVENTAVDYLREMLDENEISDLPDFKEALMRVLDRLTQFNNPRRRGAGQADAADFNPELAAAREDIRQMIEALPDLPLSPIDVIKDEIRKRGYSCGEMTGRTLEFAEGEISKRGRHDMNETVREFQNGGLDAVVIGKPAFAGWSGHADESCEDQRRRSMVLLQTPADIADLMQVLGRAHRKGQVVGPRITWINSGLAAEAKFAMMLEAHLQKLSANCTSNRDSSASRADEVPVIFNSIGQAVCKRFLEDNADIAETLDLGDVNAEEEKAAEEEDRLEKFWAQKLFARVNMLHPDLQDRVVDSVFAAYVSEVEDLNSQNANPLKVKAMPGTYRVLDSQLFEGIEGDESGDNEPVYLVTVEGTRMVQPYRSGDLLDMVDQAEVRIAQARLGQHEAGRLVNSIYRDPLDCARALERRRDQILQTMLERADGAWPTVQDALDAEEANPIKNKHAELSGRETLIRRLRPGHEVSFTGEDGQRSRAILTDVMCPVDGHEDKLSQYRLTLVSPRDDTPTRTHLGRLVEDPNFEIKPGLHGPQVDAILQAYDRAPEGEFRFRRRLLMNDILRAVQISNSQKPALGQVVAFEDDNGVVHRGLLLGRHEKTLELMPVPVAQAQAACDWIMSGEDVRRVIASSPDRRTGRGVSIQAKTENGTRVYKVNLPSARGWQSEIYEDPDVRALAEQGRQAGRARFSLAVTPAQLPGIIETLYRAGVVFHLDGGEREWLNAWTAAHQQAAERADVAEADAAARILNDAPGLQEAQDQGPEPLAPAAE